MSERADALKDFIDDLYDNHHKRILKNEDADLESLSQHFINFLTSDDKKTRIDAIDAIFSTFDPIPCLGIKVLPHGYATVYLGLLNNQAFYRPIYTLQYGKLNPDSFEYVLTVNERMPA